MVGERIASPWGMLPRHGNSNNYSSSRRSSSYSICKLSSRGLAASLQELQEVQDWGFCQEGLVGL
jgi:hypothetical protein